MTELARCKDCRALTLDTDADIRDHRLWHRDYNRKIEGIRTRANDAATALGQLRVTVADYDRTLAEQPAPIEPDLIRINDFPDEDLDDEDLDQTSVYADDFTTDPTNDTGTYPTLRPIQ